VIAGWLIKIVVSVALLGLVGYEVGSPLITRAQVDDVAHTTADAAARELADTSDEAKARAKAEQLVAAKTGMHLDAFTIGTAGDVHVTVSKKAGSIILDRFAATRGWYEIKVSADSVRFRPTR
jgi:hypothetical protein